jgi:hypothetical protein
MTVVNPPPVQEMSVPENHSTAREQNGASDKVVLEVSTKGDDHDDVEVIPL